MNIQKVRAILGWCVVINIGLLFLVLIMYLGAHDLIYSIWTDISSIPVETFDLIYMTTISFWKISVIVFMLIPYFAIRIVEGKD